MNAFLKLLNRLFARARGVGNKMSPKKQDEIIKALEDSIDKVTAGTAKIDEQIAELKAIERQLDKADEMIAPLDNLIGDLSKKTGATPEEPKRVVIDKYNQGYPPGDPKRLLPEDDDPNCHTECVNELAQPSGSETFDSPHQQAIAN